MCVSVSDISVSLPLHPSFLFFLPFPPFPSLLLYPFYPPFPSLPPSLSLPSLLPSTSSLSLPFPPSHPSSHSLPLLPFTSSLSLPTWVSMCGGILYTTVLSALHIPLTCLHSTSHSPVYTPHPTHLSTLHIPLTRLHSTSHSPLYTPHPTHLSTLHIPLTSPQPLVDVELLNDLLIRHHTQLGVGSVEGGEGLQDPGLLGGHVVEDLHTARHHQLQERNPQEARK